jgi:hypothetical protein
LDGLRRIPSIENASGHAFSTRPRPHQIPANETTMGAGHVDGLSIMDALPHGSSLVAVAQAPHVAARPPASVLWPDRAEFGTAARSLSKEHVIPTADRTLVATGVTDARLIGLRRWNLGLTAVHLAQAVLILMLAGGFAISVTSSFPEGPPGTPAPAPSTLFDVRIGWAVAVFLGLAALDHLLTATVSRGVYERDLRRGINRFRWVEYSFSATLMIVLIGFYSGITSINAVIAVAGANVGMILFGWVQERMNPPGRTSTTMIPFWFGTLVGVAPWISIAVNIIGAETVPGFVYGIVVAQFVFFFSFGLNQWLQYREVGRWADYAFGEKTYLVLSLVAKSVLAWQIFGGSLAN